MCAGEVGEVILDSEDEEEAEEEREDEGDAVELLRVVDDPSAGAVAVSRDPVDPPPRGASGATALAIAPITKFWWDDVDILVPLMLLLLDAGDMLDDEPGRFKSIWRGLTITALCITWRYAGPRRLLSPSSSESVMAR